MWKPHFSDRSDHSILQRSLKSGFHLTITIAERFFLAIAAIVGIIWKPVSKWRRKSTQVLNLLVIVTTCNDVHSLWWSSNAGKRWCFFFLSCSPNACANGHKFSEFSDSFSWFLVVAWKHWFGLLYSTLFLGPRCSQYFGWWEHDLQNFGLWTFQRVGGRSRFRVSNTGKRITSLPLMKW